MTLFGSTTKSTLNHQLYISLHDYISLHILVQGQKDTIQRMSIALPIFRLKCDGLGTCRTLSHLVASCFGFRVDSVEVYIVTPTVTTLEKRTGEKLQDE